MANAFDALKGFKAAITSSVVEEVIAEVVEVVEAEAAEMPVPVHRTRRQLRRAAQEEAIKALNGRDSVMKNLAVPAAPVARPKLAPVGIKETTTYISSWVARKGKKFLQPHTGSYCMYASERPCVWDARKTAERFTTRNLHHEEWGGTLEEAGKIVDRVTRTLDYTAEHRYAVVDCEPYIYTGRGLHGKRMGSVLIKAMPRFITVELEYQRVEYASWRDVEQNEGGTYCQTRFVESELPLLPDGARLISFEEAKEIADLHYHAQCARDDADQGIFASSGERHSLRDALGGD